MTSAHRITVEFTVTARDDITQYDIWADLAKQLNELQEPVPTRYGEAHWWTNGEARPHLVSARKVWPDGAPH